VLLYKFLCGEEIIPKKENRYYFIVDDSSGIRYNTKLYLNGYKIGKITKIEFDYDTLKTKINIATDKRIKLKQGSFITITSDLLGNKSLILDIGSGEDLENNSYVECKNSSFSFGQLVNYIQGIITKINDLQNIDVEEMKNKILSIFTDKNGGSDLLKNINDIIKNINLLMEEVKKAYVKNTVANINDILKSFKEDILACIKELKEKNKGKGFMSFSF
jgi:phospholipid/cholesterol/gamma-HCH transport system substrate-binding protein